MYIQGITSTSKCRPFPQWLVTSGALLLRSCSVCVHVWQLWIFDCSLIEGWLIVPCKNLAMHVCIHTEITIWYQSSHMFRSLDNIENRVSISHGNVYVTIAGEEVIAIGVLSSVSIMLLHWDETMSHANPLPRLPFVLTFPRLPPSHSSLRFSTTYFWPFLKCIGTPSWYRTYV